MNITVKELKERLDSYDDNATLDFSGLEFSRLKRRGPDRIQVEFNTLIARNRNGTLMVDGVAIVPNVDSDDGIIIDSRWLKDQI